MYVSHRRLSPKASNKKHTGIIKTLEGLHILSTFINFRVSLCFKLDRLLRLLPCFSLIVFYGRAYSTIVKVS